MFNRQAWPAYCIDRLSLCTAWCKWCSLSHRSICNSWHLMSKYIQSLFRVDGVFPRHGVSELHTGTSRPVADIKQSKIPNKLCSTTKVKKICIQMEHRGAVIQTSWTMKEPKVAIWNFVKLFVIYIQTPANGSRRGFSGIKSRASSMTFIEDNRPVTTSESLTAILDVLPDFHEVTNNKLTT